MKLHFVNSSVYPVRDDWYSVRKLESLFLIYSVPPNISFVRDSAIALFDIVQAEKNKQSFGERNRKYFSAINIGLIHKIIIFILFIN